MDFIIEFIKESWPVFFCLYVVHQIEILDWLAEKNSKDTTKTYEIVVSYATETTTQLYKYYRWSE